MKEQNFDINGNTALALGFFDGIHLGHQSVIRATVDYANKNNLLPVVYTFEENPGRLFGKSCEVLTTNAERTALLKDMGVKAVVLDDFLNVKDMPPRAFVEEILLKKLQAKKVFCGFNYHFGKGGVGDSRDLKEISAQFGISAEEIPPVIYEGETVSSTRIRGLIANGEIEKANTLLGHSFGFSSLVEEGNHLGRTLGTPTINQKLPENLAVPLFGVYTSIVTVGGKEYCGVTNIGVKPTVGSYSPLAETWMPEYEGGDLYGQGIDIRLLYFHRKEERFSSLSALQERIKLDGQIALRNIEKHKRNSK